MKIIEKIKKLFEPKIAYAHCDIPCGIYDPHLAQVAAHTVVRMGMLIDELTAKMNANPNPSVEDRRDFVHKLSRYTEIKEHHAEIAKHEVRILWGDYFKPELVQKYSELHDLVWKVMKAGSKAKQEANLKTAEELLESVEKIAEIFWKTKNIEPVKRKSFYITERTLVYPKL